MNHTQRKTFMWRTLLAALFVVGGLYFSACMSKSTSVDAQGTSLGSSAMPATAEIQAALSEAYSSVKGNTEGKNADYIPYLAKVNSSLFGIAIVTADGQVFKVGDTDYKFAIESVSKPFTLALAMQQSGDKAILDKLGVEPTGRPFNSVPAVEDLPGHIGNPLVNAGAMASVSIVKATSADERYKLIMDNLSKFAGESLTLNEEVYKSEADSNEHNKGIAELLKSYGRLYADPMEVVDVYTKQCSVNVSAIQLAMMGATLANSGINPKTKEKVVDANYVSKILAVMTMAGFYDESGSWAWTTGVPAKTGVGGGIVAIVPGKFAVAAFSPKLDGAGNSIRAAKAIDYIVKKLHANIFEAHTK